jgi:hypothetical protein
MDGNAAHSSILLSIFFHRKMNFLWKSLNPLKSSSGVTAVKRGQLAHLWAKASIAWDGLPRRAGGHQRGGGTLKANNSA